MQSQAPEAEAEAEASVTTAPAKIIELMEKFERDQDIYRSSQYNETELRTEFINPFFEALGWDVYHKHECRADKREVKEEDAIDVEGKIKNPDYSFRLFDKRKFFVEVKRPSINIESGVYPAYQIRRYAWSADLAISILTDFEEFSVYYCRARPSKDDKSTKSRLLYFRYDQYAEKWPEIAALFSREAVLNGSLDKYVQSLPQKRGDKRVDAALLDDISEWREMLAKSIARHNPLLDTVSLNFAVQTIIDRIIFLRICEDRGIERYMRLKDLLSGERVYPRLCELFLQADDRYNSGIFHFCKEPGRDNPDTITPGLEIDDETLKNIIKRLYFPESPYEFSVLPAEILGQIYEQFLGKVIRLDEGHNALVEDKPEVKKAGGVKYTPAYIVEYIVQNTIAPLLKEKTLQEAAALRVLDPACGSGSFLIVAYQHLLDWHKEWYIQNLVPLMESGRMSEIKKLLPARGPAHEGQEGAQPGAGAARLPGPGRGMEADHGGAQAHSAEQHLRRGHRPAGGGGDQALSSAQGAGGRERGDHIQAAQALCREGAARFEPEHQVRQLADRLGYPEGQSGPGCRRRLRGSIPLTGRGSFLRSS